MRGGVTHGPLHDGEEKAGAGEYGDGDAARELAFACAVARRGGCARERGGCARVVRERRRVLDVHDRRGAQEHGDDEATHTLLLRGRDDQG
jgi:hypothetical protein